MKRIFMMAAVVLCSLNIAAAQDLEKAAELYNNAAAAIETDKAGAINLFEQAMDIAGTLGDEGNDILSQCKGIIPKLYLSLGKELASAKDTDGAVEKIKKAIEVAQSFGDEETLTSAKALLPQVLMMGANSLLKAKDYAGAISAYQDIINVDPTNGNALLNLGQCLAAAGKTDDAVKAFEQAMENGQEEKASKQLSNIFVKKAVACQQAKDLKGALENALLSTQYVDNANAEKIIGLSALQLKQNKVAAEAFEAYLAMSPDAKDKVQIMYQLGTALAASGDSSKACGYFKQISQDEKWGEAARYQIANLKCN